MEIRTLATISISELAAVFNTAFTGYFVPISLTVAGMEDRIARARIDLSQSVGAFEGEELVAFMLTGVQERDGKKWAYNAGTGVVPDFRRRRLVKQMYAWGEDLWRAAGFTDLCLEVIVENAYAIRAYQGVGLQIGRRIVSYKYERPDTISTLSILAEAAQPDWPAYEQLRSFQPSWDYNRAGVEAVVKDYRFFEWKEEGQLKGFAIVHQNGRIAQAGCLEPNQHNWETLLEQLAIQYSSMTWINIDVEANTLLSVLQDRGWTPIIEQYEMFRSL